MKVKEIMQVVQKKGESLLIPFISAGDPDLEVTKQILREFDRLGIEIMELGVPYSDPVADGATIMSSYDRALAGGVTLAKVLNMVKELRGEGLKVKIILFSYLNPIFVMGYEKFVKLGSEAGVDSMLLVDLPLEESGELQIMLEKVGIGMLQLASPTTTVERLRAIDKFGPDFLYYVSRVGVTGVQSDLSNSLEEEVKKVKEHVKCPIAVGFGISKREHVLKVSQFAQASIVGSFLVKCLGEEVRNDEKVKKVVEAIKSLMIDV